MYQEERNELTHDKISNFLPPPTAWNVLMHAMNISRHYIGNTNPLDTTF